jgi:hypothetical protein
MPTALVVGACASAVLNTINTFYSFICLFILNSRALSSRGWSCQVQFEGLATSWVRTLDDLANTDGEREWASAVVAGVKLGSRALERASVVHRQTVALLWVRLAVALRGDTRLVTKSNIHIYTLWSVGVAANERCAREMHEPNQAHTYRRGRVDSDSHDCR